MTATPSRLVDGPVHTDAETGAAHDTDRDQPTAATNRNAPAAARTSAGA